MSEHVIEWRTVYGKKRMLFVDGRGVGDYYPTGEVEGAFRVRWWRPGKVTDGDPQAMVTTAELAEAQLLEWAEQRRAQDDAA